MKDSLGRGDEVHLRMKDRLGEMNFHLFLGRMIDRLVGYRGGFVV